MSKAVKVFRNFALAALLVLSGVAMIIEDALCVQLAPGDWRRTAACNAIGGGSGGGCVNQEKVINGVLKRSVISETLSYETCRVTGYGTVYKCEVLSSASECVVHRWYTEVNCQGDPIPQTISQKECQQH